MEEENEKGKEKFSAMLTSHDDGYTEPVYNTSDMGESILDDEEEWHADEAEDEEEGAGDGETSEDEDADAEMVIEEPLQEPQAALLDVDDDLNEDGTPAPIMEPVSLKNILPPGSTRRTRPTTFN